MKIFLIAVSIILILTAGVCLENESPTKLDGSISGLIKNKEGNPIAGATVTLLHQEEATGQQIKSVQSDSKGKYLFNNLKEGKNCIRIEAEGYVSEEKHGTMLKAGDAVTNINFTLEKGVTVSGKVKNTEGESVENATVGAWTVDENLDRALSDWEFSTDRSDAPEVRTDSEGAFVLKGLRKEGHKYTVWAKSEKYSTGKVKNVAAGSADIEIVLKLGGSIQGKAIQADTKEPIPKAKVSFTSREPRRTSTNYNDCDETGNFSFLGLSPGVYELSARSEKLVSRTPKEVKVAAGDAISGVELELTKGLSLSGKAKEKETDKGIEGVNIELDHDQFGSYSTVTDADGNYRIEGLGPGKCNIHVRSDEYIAMLVKRFGQQSGQREIIISDKDVEGIDFEFILGGSVSGNVVNSRGEPISGTSLYIKQKPESMFDFNFSEPGSTQTDENGKFSIKGIAPDSGYVVVAKHTEYAQAESQKVEVKSGIETSGIHIVMTSGGSISGRITSTEGKAIEGARIKAGLIEQGFFGYIPSLFEPDGEGGIKSGPDGKYKIPNLSNGKYAVSARANGYAPAVKKDVDVSERAETNGVDIILPAGNFISGKVTDENGAPIAGANIWAHTMDFRSMSQGGNAITDSEGHYRIEDLGEGQFSISCSTQGYGSESKLQVPTNSADVNFILKKEGIITGQVLNDATSEPVTSFSISRIKETGNPFGGSSFSAGEEFHSEGGEFKVETEDGNYSLETRADGFAPGIVHDIRVESGKTTEGVIIRLGKGGSATGYVLNGADRTPVSDAKVWQNEGGQFPMFDTIDGGTGAGEIKTKPDGSFLLEGLTPGSISISASHPDYPNATVTGVQVISGQTTAGVEILLSAGGKIIGHIYDEDKKPVAGAMVMAQPMDMRDIGSIKEPAAADEQGYYKIENLKPGNYQVMKMDKNFIGGSMEFRQIKLNAGETLTVDFGTTVGCRLYGVVTRAGAALSGSTIMVFPKDYLSRQSEHASTGTGMTNDKGFYEIKNLPPGEYVLSVQNVSMAGTSLSSSSFEIQIQNVSEMEYNVNLASGNTINGTVITTSSGVPVDGAQVMLIPGNEEGLVSPLSFMNTVSGFVMTGADGSFQFNGVQDGTYKVTAVKQGFCKESTEPIKIVGGMEPPTQTIRLSQGGTVVGAVTDRDTGLPVSGACVSDRTEGNEAMILWEGTSGYTDASGRYTISGIKAGAGSIIAWAEGYGQVTASVQVVEGQKTTKDFSLSKGGTAAFLISDETGSPVSGAAIEIKDNKGEKVEHAVPLMDLFGAYAGDVSDAEGGSVWTSLGEGEYTVTASKDGFSPASTNFSIRPGAETLVKIGLKK